MDDEWFKIFEALGNRIWIPHQVILEFWRRRATLASSPDNINKTRNDIETNSTKLIRNFNNWISNRHLSADSEGTAQEFEKVRQLIINIENTIQQMQTLLSDAEQSHKQRFSPNPEYDEIVKKLSEFEEKGTIVIGEEYNQDQLRSEIKEAERRFANRIPPGYMDDANQSDAKNKKSTDKKYGDYILWKQLLDYAKNKFTNYNNEDNYFIFVTADRKEDWWQKHHTPSDEEDLYIARSELVDEMRLQGNANYLQLSPTEFLEVAEEHLNVSISKNTIDSSKNTSNIFHIKDNDGATIATAEIDITNGKIKIFKGSRSPYRLSKSIYHTNHTFHSKLIKGGILVPFDETKPVEEFGYKFDEDYFMNSISRATMLLAGTDARYKWEDGEGRKLIDLRDEIASQENNEGIEE